MAETFSFKASDRSETTGQDLLTSDYVDDAIIRGSDAGFGFEAIGPDAHHAYGGSNSCEPYAGDNSCEPPVDLNPDGGETYQLSVTEDGTFY